jgi:hypothetical protein
MPPENRSAFVGERRSCKRFDVNEMEGTLIFMSERFPVQIKNISLTGCLVEARKRFRAGALQTVELEIHYLGVSYQLYGETEWSKSDQWIGVRFLHPSANTRLALKALMQVVMQTKSGSLSGQPSEASSPAPAASVQSALASAPATMAPPSVPAVEDHAPVPSSASRVSLSNRPAARLSPEFLRVIHQGALRAQCASQGEWTAELMLIDNGIRVTTEVLDISLRGCTVQAEEAFGEEIDSRAQIVFQISGHRFVLSAEPTALEDHTTLGIKFIDINDRRRQFLNSLILDLRNNQ